MEVATTSPVVKFRFHHDWANANKFIDASPGRPFFTFQDSEKLLSFSLVVRSCIVLTSIENKEDLLEIAKLVDSVQKEEDSLKIKIVVVNFSGSDEIEPILARLGISDMIDPQVSFEGFKFDMDFWLATMDLNLTPEAHEARELDQMTETPIVEAQIKRETESFSCILEDANEKTFSFKLSREGLKLGDLVELDITFAYLNKKSCLMAKARVSQLDFENALVTLELVGSDIVQLNALMNIFLERQRKVTSFFDAIKGH